MFLCQISPKCSQILLKYWPVMQCKVMNHICDCCWCSFKHSKELITKSWILSSYVLSVRPQILSENESHHKVTKILPNFINIPYAPFYSSSKVIVTSEAVMFGMFWVVFHSYTFKCGQVLLKCRQVMKCKLCYGFL